MLGQRVDQGVRLPAYTLRIRRRCRSKRPDSSSRARTSCSRPGEPRSWCSFSSPIRSTRAAGATVQPSRTVGASDLLTVPIATTRSGARPCTAPTGSLVVAELGVVVVLDDPAVPLGRPSAPAACRRCGESTTPVGHWCAASATTARDSRSAPSASTRTPCSSTGHRHRCRRPRARLATRPVSSYPGSSNADPPHAAPRPSAASASVQPLREAGADHDPVGAGGGAADPGEVAGQHGAQLLARRAGRRSRSAAVGASRQASRTAHAQSERGNDGQVGDGRQEVDVEPRRTPARAGSARDSCSATARRARRGSPSRPGRPGSPRPGAGRSSPRRAARDAQSAGQLAAWTGAALRRARRPVRIAVAQPAFELAPQRLVERRGRAGRAARDKPVHSIGHETGPYRGPAAARESCAMTTVDPRSRAAPRPADRDRGRGWPPARFVRLAARRLRWRCAASTCCCRSSRCTPRRRASAASQPG